MYQPPPGASSTTVMPGLMPKNVSVSYGWRALSRSALAGVRALPAMAAFRAASLLSAASAAPLPPQASMTVRAAARDTRFIIICSIHEWVDWWRSPSTPIIGQARWPVKRIPYSMRLHTRAARWY